MIRITPGGLVARNVLLKDLIDKAYGLRPHQLVGGPDWVHRGRERFEVIAKPPDGTRPEQILEMLKALLADRFGLRVRAETVVRPIYALVLARKDGRLGPSLRPSRHDCDALLAEGRAPGPDERDANGGPVACADRTAPVLRGPFNIMKFSGVSMSRAASLMGAWVDRPLFDRTGLAGHFDVGLLFSSGTGAEALASQYPVFAIAIREQLGLRLESDTGPVELLVIEAVDRPTPN
jgi:uncharacterized protein (TIGR03435 family)